MKAHLSLSVMATLLVSASASAALIDGSSIVATASQEEARGTAQETVDGTGLSVNGTHSVDFEDGWSTGTTTPNRDDPPLNTWIQWDLGDLYVLDSVHIWNSNADQDSGGGIYQTDIWVSSLTSNPGDPTNNPSNWTLIDEDALFSQGTGLSTYTGFDLETQVGNILPSTAVQFVRFEVDETFYSAGLSGTRFKSGWVTFSEIQFTAVPEPSSFALIAGFLGLTWVMLRRRG